MDPIFQEESARLSWTKEQYLQAAEDERLMLSALPRLYPNDPNLLNELLLHTHNRIVRLEQSRSKPYFARIDFTDGSSAQTDRCYIGKIGVSDQDGQIITVDWRAPVASLYYDSNLGKASYQAPEGMIFGTLSLKRQYEIEKGTLLSYHDVDSVSDDELLKPFLSASADSRLKNIVASIQTEQNRIIREDLHKNLIVQGAAGSGKTTVALHRIAYLVYRWRDSIRPSQYMVIGPNLFFISYISAVLPDLDVDNVPQFTYETLAARYLDENFMVQNPAETLAAILERGEDTTVQRYKSSLAYRDALDRFLCDFEDSLLPEGPFSPFGVPLLSEQQVQAEWQSAKEVGGSCLTRVNKAVLLLSAALAAERDRAFWMVDSWFGRQMDGAGKEEAARIFRQKRQLERELDSGCKKLLRRFFSGIDVKILSVYRRFLEQADCYLPQELAASVRRHALAPLRKRKVAQEDLPALIYLKTRIFGAEDYARYRHVVVDEAQDLGEFAFFALQKLLSGSTFTVVGDLAQSIYGFHGIESWEPVQKRSFSQGAEICHMEKSYRTTVEIMKAANLLTESMELPAAQPVIRHGDPVRLHPILGDSVQAVADCIRADQALGFGSIAVLGKTAVETARMHAALVSLGIPIQLIDDEADSYSGGVCAMTGYLSKGLEFDGVILLDAGEPVYRSDRRLDLHLLYVAMTRPLHRLDIFYSEKPCAPLCALLEQGASGR